MSDSLLEYVLAELEKTKGTWRLVARETGVSRRTIEKIATSEIADPGVIKIEKLARYFRQREHGVAPSSSSHQEKRTHA